MMGYIESMKRKDPKLNVEESIGLVLIGLVGGGLLGAGGVMGISSFLAGKIQIDSFASLLQYLFTASFVIVGTGLCALVGVIGIYTLFQRRKWFKGTSRGGALIIDRELVYREDQYGNVTGSRFEFVLKIDHSPKADFSDQVVRMAVSERIYKKYAKGDAVGVYYSSADPLEFLIEGE
jgi:hypothetical protein